MTYESKHIMGSLKHMRNPVLNLLYPPYPKALATERKYTDGNTKRPIASRHKRLENPAAIISTSRRQATRLR
jgi:hypothetical protein